jgi:hypothetical protein
MPDSNPFAVMGIYVNDIALIRGTLDISNGTREYPRVKTQE